MKKTLCLLLLLVSRAAFGVEVPVNIGVGPSAFYIPERLQEEDPEPFYGLRLHIKAVIDKDLIKKHKNKIPKQYHKAVEKVDEVRVGYLLIPESIMVSPRKKEGGMELYGATWKPVGVGLPIKMGPATLSLGTGLIATYAYVNIGSYKILEDEDPEDIEDVNYRDQVTHFLRPGMDLSASLEIKFSKSFLTSVGWSSAYYLPQEIGGGVFSMGLDRLEHSLWRIHQAYLMAHYRIPVSASL